MQAQTIHEINRLVAENAVTPESVANCVLIERVQLLTNALQRQKTVNARLHEQIGRIQEQGARWKSKAQAAEGTLKKYDVHAMVYDMQEAKRIAKEIHQQLKRGDATQDHGLLGNLRCILDHLIDGPPPLI